MMKKVYSNHFTNTYREVEERTKVTREIAPPNKDVSPVLNRIKATNIIGSLERRVLC